MGRWLSLCYAKGLLCILFGIFLYYVLRRSDTLFGSDRTNEVFYPFVVVIEVGILILVLWEGWLPHLSTIICSALLDWSCPASDACLMQWTPRIWSVVTGIEQEHYQDLIKSGRIPFFDDVLISGSTAGTVALLKPFSLCCHRLGIGHCRFCCDILTAFLS